MGDRQLRPLSAITAGSVIDHEGRSTGNFEAVHASNGRNLDVHGNVGEAVASYSGRLKITGHVMKATAYEHGGITILNSDGKEVDQIRASDSGTVICKSGVNNVVVQDDGTVIIEGHTASIVARIRGDVYVVGDVDSAFASDNGTIHVFGNVKKACAGTNGLIYVSGKIEEYVPTRSDRHNMVVANYRANRVRSFVEESLGRIA